MRILVTGSEGLLGRSCVQVGQGRHDILGLGIGELDVTDREAVGRCLADARPDGVIHCAAYTDVDGAESAEQRAMEVNADGAEWVALAAHGVGAVMVYISTDYVFDGEKKAPYRESDPPHPLSHYGVSKLEGERRVAGACPQAHLIVRTAWLYGAGAGLVDWVCQELEAGRPLDLVSDHTGSPTYAMDLAGGVFRLLEQGHRGLFHFVNRGQASWLELGRAVASLIGRPERLLRPTRAAELSRAAPRPGYSVLAVERYEQATRERVADWRNALGRYLHCAGRLG